MADLYNAVVKLAHENPELQDSLLPILEAHRKKAIGWKKLPRGWTQESVDKFWGSLTGDVKHKVTKCIKRMEPHMGEGAGGFCASLADQVEGSTDWRKGPRKDKKAKGGGKWIQDAIKHPGRVREYLGIPEGKTIPMGKLKAAIKKLKESGSDPSMLDALQMAVTLKTKVGRARRANVISQTIADQMGGVRRIKMMLGARTVKAIPHGLAFDWRARQRSRGNYVEITLEPSDTYKMEFFNVSVRGRKSVKMYRDVYAEDLVTIFEKQTGWYLRLGSEDVR